VLIRSLTIGREPLNIVQYRQMCGRAGRAGLTQCGESFLLVKAADKERWVHLRLLLLLLLSRV
jgi:replicative superfamily II helicase